ncbi:hypothetical protein CTI12_AA375050 [Artemisia annua]|uniref:Uncharacterized protein n=1 Tax=Artemisia annua TaxID=35608 RepID=A0A2U1MJ11_ARTAN|nr:hypothetical protein CTI12_AA375050 [Artemisia annua]
MVIRVSNLIPIFIIFLLLIATSPSYGLKNNKNQVKEECESVVSKSQCVKNINCRWCQSDVLDDSCFTKSESLRLPSHLFICLFL